ncbi:unnamed protein product [Adineta steineri]|uniref:Uncharacterized protein n=1 Tax=Adineta steineri TaxID=433720 RepID=A0A815L521_9BILA|nr:unnamed protein product [Adineta steineri]CAF4016888.1 unnamed protein product [Adineta steineri]
MKVFSLILVFFYYIIVLVNTSEQQQQLPNSTTISICNFTACNSQRTPCSSNRNCECFSLTISPSVGICASAVLSCTDVVRCNTDNRTCPIENTVCVNSTRCGQPVCYPLALANKLVCPINTTAATTTTTHAGGLTNTTRSTTKAITTTDSRFTPSTANCSSIVATNCTTTTSIVAACQSYEVSWNNHCYYLDGSDGSCITGYSLATNAILNCISSLFIGKNYRNTTSNDCCILTADTYECFGFNVDCNNPGPFTEAPILGGANCINQVLRYSQQLTFCGSN